MIELDMSSQPRLHAYTYADYLAHEAASNVKHEYLDGEIYARAGGSPEHASLAMVIGSSLVRQLEGKGCRVFSSDLRVRVVETGLTTHPDVSVVCGSLERDEESSETALNPKVLVEVLSDGTESYDRGEKFEHYKRIPSFEECVLVSQKEPVIEVWRREGGSWAREEGRGGARLVLRSIDCQLNVDEIYRGVFEP
jgi:Uma2 family endonuclease